MSAPITSSATLSLTGSRGSGYALVKKYALIALVVLAICTFVSRAVVMRYREMLPVVMVSDAFTPCGWAAVWAPATVILHELWPISDLRQSYQAIIDSEIEVLSDS